MDGFGRTIQTSSGATSTLSIVDVQYAPCGCSPLGKLSQQSQPYAPGGTQAWTTYHYDASGRTTSVVLPDGSTTTYLYQGNSVWVTDPAAKWKQFFMDALGNLSSVYETDPVLGSVGTGYGYDILNHLVQVYMPRGATTQQRFFNYTSGTTVGAFLLSATNPENGTVSYTYTPANLLGTKTDAKGQQLAYWYDSYNRLTSVHWYNAPGGAQVLRTYYYDTNPLDSTGTFSQYAAGRLTAVQYRGLIPFSYAPNSPGPIQLVDMYSYTQAGLPAAKRLQVNESLAWVYHNVNNQATGTQNLDSTYTYNNQGEVTAMTYPGTTTGYTNGVPINVTGASYNYSYDSMYRLSGMTDSGSNTIVSGVSYDAASRLLTMNYPGSNETRSYNVLGQLTSIGGGANVTYNYPTGTNNGKVSSISFSGETVTYTYDSLNRLATANGSGWGEAYTFDPFGNLTTKHVTAGSGPSLSVAVDQSTNHLGSTDANGNMAGNVYDVENRISGAGWANGAPIVDYGYDAQGKRFFIWPVGTLDPWGGNDTNYSVVMYSPSGQKLGTYLISVCNQGANNTTVLTICSALANSDKYFGGRRLAVMDQLGSAGTYYPWGEAKGSTNPQDAWSYATHWRDSVSGLDYANQRYYSNTYGRFMTPDPSWRSADLRNPQSWNRYAYVLGDPVNGNDPTGLAMDVNQGDSWPIDASYDPSFDPSFGPGPNGDPNEAWYRQVDRETAMLDALEGKGVASWDFANGNINELNINIGQGALGGFMDSLLAEAAATIEVGLIIGNPVADGVITIAITAYGAYELYQWLSKNPAVTAPWTSFKQIQKELESWKYNQVDQKYEQDCPPGSKVAIRTMHWNPPDQYHAFGHYDYVDCEGKSWSIWGDGTMTPNK